MFLFKRYAQKTHGLDVGIYAFWNDWYDFTESEFYLSDLEDDDKIIASAHETPGNDYDF